MSLKDAWPKPKNWKQVYTRSEKNRRARQLGIDYPIVTDRELARKGSRETNERINVLFVCSRNQWRSPTAERMWQGHPHVNARSAGTSPNARHPVSVDDLRWADVILVMEEKHKSRLLAEFTRVLEHTPIHVLDIPDDYQYMDPELIDELRRAVAPLLRIDAERRSDSDP